MVGRVAFLAGASDDKTQSGAAPSGVSLPDTAVQSEGAGSATGVVFVLHDDVVERRAVKLGAKIGSEQITVLSGVNRSEEHTSELQSLMRNSYADFCLKKKKQK